MSEIVNQGLYNVKPGDSDFAIEVDLNDAQSRNKDHFLPGRYEFEVTKASWTAKSGDKPGRNFTYAMKCVGPKGCSEVGKAYQQSSAAPCGTPDHVESIKGFVASVVASALSFDGKLQAILDNQAGKVMFAPRQLVGKHIACEMVEDQPYFNAKTGKSYPQSNISRILMKDEYEARNGVDASAAQTPPPAATQQAKATGAAKTPDLMQQAQQAAAGGNSQGAPTGAAENAAAALMGL